MEVTKTKINLLRILYFDLGNMSHAKGIGSAFKQKFGRNIGNIYDELNDMIKLGIINKDIQTKTYQLSAKGELLLKSRVNIPEVHIVSKEVIVEKLYVSPNLYALIQEEARKEKQTVPEWIIGSFEILFDIKEEKHEEKGNGDIGNNQSSQM